MIRVALLIAGCLIGALAVILAPDALRHKLSHHHAEATVPKPHEDDSPTLRLDNAQIETAGIKLTRTGPGELKRRLSVPGTIVPSGDRIARVAIRLSGTVLEVRKHLGDPVAAGEVVAVIESREVADAKTEYLATKLTNDLQQTLFSRSKSLFEAKVTSENEFLRVRTTALDAQVKFDVARQKLAALGLSEQQLAELHQQPVESLRRYELRAPLSGRIAERRVDVGSLVGREGVESELFVIVDIAQVWVELAIPFTDLPGLREGQEITINNPAIAEPANAKVIFISPVLDKDTRSVRVVALLDNSRQVWRPGGFATAEIPLPGVSVPIAIPKGALQSVDGQPVVFVRSAQGFEKRAVQARRSDGQVIEIVSGLDSGDEIAVANSFVLKAELGKRQAEHHH